MVINGCNTPAIIYGYQLSVEQNFVDFDDDETQTTFPRMNKKRYSSRINHKMALAFSVSGSFWPFDYSFHSLAKTIRETLRADFTTTVFSEK